MREPIQLRLKPETWFTTQLAKPFQMLNAFNADDKMIAWLGNFTEQYYTPLCPIFTSQIESPQSVANYEIITLRDGLIPLLWFFRRIKNPEDLQPQLLVHKSLESFIPSNWVDHINFYQISSKSDLSPNRDKILITGLIADQYSTLECFNAAFDTVIKHIENYGDKEIEIYFPVVMDPFYIDEMNHTKVFEFMALASKRLPEITKIWTTKEFIKTDRFNDYSFLELNSTMLFEDSSLAHKIMRKGGYNLKIAAAPSSSIDLSPYHQINIYFNESRESSSSIDKLLAEFEELYQIKNDKGRCVERPFGDKVMEAKSLLFPNDFYLFMKANYNRL